MLNAEGGCFCGEIRYKIGGIPVLQLYCFCEDCLSLSGTDGYAGIMIKQDDFEVTRGVPTCHEKTSRENRKVVRNFCGTCGTNIWGKTSFGLISVAAGTLDDPGLFNPSKSVFTEDAPHWARIPENIERS